MVAVTRLGLYGGPRPPYAGFTAASASIALTGTVTTAAEADIVSGSRTVILTVANDTWVTAGATFNAQRQAIINGLTSAGVELLGWNNEVRDKEVVGAVTRDSDTQVTILLTASAAYDITADETITATIPADALTTSAIAVVASPTFAVTFTAVVVGGKREAGGKKRKRRSRYMPLDELTPESIAAANLELAPPHIGDDEAMLLLLTL